MTHTRIVILLGSLRADSLNRRIAEPARAQAPAGVKIEIAEGLDQIPFYNEDIDGEQVPAAARALREVVGRADRVLAVTPEYNGTMPAVLNNAIDWLSRPYGVGAHQGKPFAVVGATPTPYGGKWSHDDARRSARIAGADVLDHVVVSEPALEGDILADPEIVAKLVGALDHPGRPPARAAPPPDTSAGSVHAGAMSELTPYLCVADARLAPRVDRRGARRRRVLRPHRDGRRPDRPRGADPGRSDLDGLGRVRGGAHRRARAWAPAARCRCT